MRTSLLALLSLIVASSCGSQDADPSAAGDAGTDAIEASDPDGDASTMDALAESGANPDVTEASTPPVWRPIREPGDATGDCLVVDTECSADLLQTEYMVEGDVYRFAIELASEFPQEAGSLELFLMPPFPPLVGYSVQVIEERVVLWKADCSTARGAWRHAGCHWAKMATPDHLQTQWVSETRFEIALGGTALFGGATTLLVGAGAAPFAIEKTAEFTDRYPDEVWVTATEILGLAEISLAP